MLSMFRLRREVVVDIMRLCAGGRGQRGTLERCCKGLMDFDSVRQLRCNCVAKASDLAIMDDADIVADMERSARSATRLRYFFSLIHQSG